MYGVIDKKYILIEQKEVEINEIIGVMVRLNNIWKSEKTTKSYLATYEKQKNILMWLTEIGAIIPDKVLNKVYKKEKFFDKAETFDETLISLYKEVRPWMYE